MGYYEKLLTVIDDTVLIHNNTCITGVDQIVETIIDQYLDLNKKLFFIGNGGSAAIAIHMTADYMKNGGFKTVGMYDPSTITCLGNDYGYEFIFSKQLERLMQPEDLLVAISSSGNSENIVNAIKVAHEKGAKVITLTGFKPDNKAKQMGDFNLYVPSLEYGIVESIHNMILQQIVDEVSKADE